MYTIDIPASHTGERPRLRRLQVGAPRDGSHPAADEPRARAAGADRGGADGGRSRGRVGAPADHAGGDGGDAEGVHDRGRPRAAKFNAVRATLDELMQATLCANGQLESAKTQVSELLIMVLKTRRGCFQFTN